MLRRRLFASTALAVAGLLLLITGGNVYGQDVSKETAATAPNATVVPFTNPGNTSWIAPAGVTWVKVEVWGAGGAGGSASGNFFAPAVAGGGGGGAYSRTVMQLPGGSYGVSVGPGSFGNGGNSSFGTGSSFVSAAGGLRGNDASPGNASSGGSGGFAGAGAGVFRVNGGFGGPGSQGNGGGGFGSNVYGIGQSGFPPGGGAGGGGSNGGTGTGGQGANGKVVITYPAVFSISGLVTAADGRAIRRATVRVTGPMLATPITVSVNRFGMYTITNVPEGTHTLSVTAGRFSFATPSRSVASVTGTDLTNQNFVAN
jgi:hypothetical protein